MGSHGLFRGTIPMLEKSLDVRSLKHNLIVSNIANKDTPTYKAFELVVEKEIEKLTGERKPMAPLKTNAAHLSSGDANGKFSGVTVKASSNGVKNSVDGNTVDVEKEMTNLAENNLMYDAMTIIMRKKFQGLKNAIQGGGK